MIAEFNRSVAQRIALENFVIAMARALQRHVPAFEQSLRQIQREADSQYRLMSIPGMAPEQSDAVSADYFEAWQNLMKQVLQRPQEDA